MAFKKSAAKEEPDLKDEEHEDDDTPNQNGHEEDVEMADDGAALKAEDGSEEDSKKAIGSALFFQLLLVLINVGARFTDTMHLRSGKKSTSNGTSKKRIKLEPDDEPPSKRQKSTVVSMKSDQATARASKESAPPGSAEKRTKVKQENSLAPQETPVVNKKKRAVIEDDEDDLNNDAEEDVAEKSTANRAAEHDKSEDESPEEQDEDEESEEDEQPEVAAKAREKVQSTLKSSSEDPYPDWKAGDPVPYAALCTTFSKIEMTTKRLEIAAHCSLFLRQVLRLTPDDLLPTILLMINKLAADYAGIELGIGESLIMKAIGEATGRSLQVIKADQNEIGDLGLVAAKSRGNQRPMFKPKALTVRGVHSALMGIATIEGQGAQARKVAGIMKLLTAADVESAGKGSKGVDITKDKGGPSESKFIVRTLEGKLRLGLADKTVLPALAQAVVIHETAQKGNKVPSTEQLAKGERTLKSVYRYRCFLYFIFPAADSVLANYQATKSSFPPSSNMDWQIFTRIASFSLASRSSLCLRSQRNLSPKSLTDLKASNLPASISTMASVLRSILSRTTRLSNTLLQRLRRARRIRASRTSSPGIPKT